MLTFKDLLLTGVGEEASGKGKMKGQLLSKAKLAGSSPAEEGALAHWAHWSGSDCLSWKAPQGVRDDGGLALPCSLPPAGQGRARRFRSRVPSAKWTAPRWWPWHGPRIAEVFLFRAARFPKLSLTSCMGNESLCPC